MAIFIYSENLKDRFSSEKPVVEKVTDTDNGRIVLFFLKKGQIIELHRSPSDVIVTVLFGKGRFFIGSKDVYRDINCGETVIYEPNELHGFEAIEDMVVQAVITPIPVKKIEL
ncbi:MAG: cupin domain-containing protein [Hydrogenothermaceae bacterium]